MEGLGKVLLGASMPTAAHRSPLLPSLGLLRCLGPGAPPLTPPAQSPWAVELVNPHLGPGNSFAGGEIRLHDACVQWALPRPAAAKVGGESRQPGKRAWYGGNPRATARGDSLAT